VINIILKRDYTGAEVTASYGDTFDAAARNDQYSLNAGYSLLGGRTRLTLSASYQESQPMAFRDRADIFKRFVDRFVTGSALGIPITAQPPAGYTPNIRSSISSQLLVLKNGTPLNSTFTSIPIGYAGVATDGGAALVSRAGIYNTDLPRMLSTYGQAGCHTRNQAKVADAVSFTKKSPHASKCSASFR